MDLALEVSSSGQFPSSRANFLAVFVHLAVSLVHLQVGSGPPAPPGLCCFLLPHPLFGDPCNESLPLQKQVFGAVSSF